MERWSTVSREAALEPAEDPTAPGIRRRAGLSASEARQDFVRKLEESQRERRGRVGRDDRPPEVAAFPDRSVEGNLA
jgi:hypothetical protein